jgi:hypothetical protein
MLPSRNDSGFEALAWQSAGAGSEAGEKVSSEDVEQEDNDEKQKMPVLVVGKQSNWIYHEFCI